MEHSVTPLSAALGFLLPFVFPLATLSAAPTRTCLFTPTGGAPRDLVIADWSATVNGAPHELVVGEHRCGFHRFRGGWTFPGFDPRQRNEVVMTGTFEAPSDGEVAAGLSGDWFYDLALDGKAVFSTGSGGNGTSEYGYWNKTAKFPVTACLRPAHDGGLVCSAL